MSKQYIVIANPSKADLDKIQVGDKVKCNAWRQPLTVKAVSDNYFIMVRNCKGDAEYSICEKTPCRATYNGMLEGYPTIGMDFWIFGKFDYFKQDDREQCLKELESGETQLSRTAMALKKIQYKRGKKDE